MILSCWVIRHSLNIKICLETAEIIFYFHFGHQGGSRASFKYPVMLDRSIWLFRHPEHKNSSIIDAMTNSSRIRKNATENREHTDREQTDRESNYRGHHKHRWIVGLSGPILNENIRQIITLPYSINDYNTHEL